jgi:glucokinase
VVQDQLPSQDYPSLEALTRVFLDQVGGQVDTACFAVAGPVIEGRAKLTNLPWVIEVETIAKALNLRSVHLLNDLEAIALGLPALETNELVTLNPGEPLQGGAIAVIAPGTGLGEAFLTWDGARYRAHPSEGGHSDFAPTDPQQIGLLQFLLRRFHHVSVERVCSGIGIPNIYDFLRESGHAVESAALAAQLLQEDDRTPLIVDSAQDAPEENPLSVATLEMFLSILGAEASNLALKVLATGGVYVAGGIPPRILPALQNGIFMRAFRNKGRYEELLSRLPVHVVTRPAAILGAALYGLQAAASR